MMFTEKSDRIFPLRGPRIVLAPLETHDVDQVTAFFSDVTALYEYLPDTLLPRNRHQLDVMMKDWNDGVHNFVFAVRLIDGCRDESSFESGEQAGGEKTIGLVTLSDLDPIAGKAELGIMLSAASFRKKGYAREALSLILDYAFGELRLHRVYVRIAPSNLASIRLFESLGFQKEGRIRDAMRRGNGYVDLLFYGLLEDEYHSTTSQEA